MILDTVFIPLQLKNESAVSLLYDSLRNNEKGRDDTITDHRILLIDQTYENDVPIISLSSSVKVALAVILTLSILIGTFFNPIYKRVDLSFESYQVPYLNPL